MTQNPAHTNQAGQLSTISSQSLIVSVLAALARWNTSAHLPAGLSSTSLDDAIQAQRRLMAPATAEQMRQHVGALLVHAAATGIKCESVDALLTVWGAYCADMPAQLLNSGTARVLKRWTNTYCLPAPGAVWEEIRAECRALEKDLNALENYRAAWLKAAAREKHRSEAAAYAAPTPVDEGMSAETERILAETRRVLRSAGFGSDRARPHPYRPTGAARGYPND